MPNLAATIDSLGAVISADPALSVQMIKIANSPMFSANRPIEDLSSSLSRLGAEFAAKPATGLALRQMFQATNDLIDRKLRSIWLQATGIAAMSAVIAKNYTRLQDSLTPDRVIDGSHGSLGTMILQSSGFPPEIALVPAHYLDFDRKPEHADITDIVMVANLQNVAGSQHPLAQPDRKSIQVFDNLGLDPNDQSGQFEDLTADVQAARDVFN